MGRRGKIDEYKLAEHLKTGVTDKQAGIDFGDIVSRQSITLKRAKFEKLDQSDPRWLPPRAELVISKRGRRRKSQILPHPVKPTTLPDYQLREYIRLAVKEEMKSFFGKIANIDELTRERDFYKEQARIAQRTFSKIEQSQKEYELLIKQGQIQAPLTATNPKKDNPDILGRTIYLCGLPLLDNITIGNYVNQLYHNIINLEERLQLCGYC